MGSTIHVRVLPALCTSQWSVYTRLLRGFMVLHTKWPACVWSSVISQRQCFGIFDSTQSTTNVRSNLRLLLWDDANLDVTRS
jgi:hypothetical protein